MTKTRRKRSGKQWMNIFEGPRRKIVWLTNPEVRRLTRLTKKRQKARTV